MTVNQVTPPKIWEHQSTFQDLLKIFMYNVLRVLGVADSEAKSECLLFGARSNPGLGQMGGFSVSQSQNNACEYIVTGDRHYSVNLFKRLVKYAKKRRQNSTKDSVFFAVDQIIKYYDTKCGVKSFLGSPTLINGYCTVPVLQLPQALFNSYPSLSQPDIHENYSHPRYVSLIHAAVSKVLDKASDHLCQNDGMKPIAGTDPGVWAYASDDVIREAAKIFMQTPVFCIGYTCPLPANLFEVINIISSLLYEKQKELVSCY